ncbi:DUF7365 family protein [Staphylococcus pseudoxylosus]|uniref:DUF7365 family protein n=1 Tax=Staphylococcus pseudoxylosus TaxID=2282419 RepID=UPI0039060245
MDETHILNWLIFSVLPVVVAIFTLVFKFGKDKRDHEHRITNIESSVNNQKEDIKEIKDTQERQREETKIILEVSSKIDTLTNRFDTFENRFYEKNDKE